MTLDQSSSPFQVDFFWGKHDSANERWFLQANGIHDVNEFALVFPFSFNLFFRKYKYADYLFSQKTHPHGQKKHEIYQYAANPRPSDLIEVLAAKLMSISRRGIIALIDST